MKKIVLSLFLSAGLVAGNGAFAQKSGEKITPDVLKSIKVNYKNEPAIKALTNAVSSNSIKKLALNREHVGEVDHLYKYRVNVSGITHQKKSGRCWMFTSLNMLRPKAMDKFNIKEFEFSTNYLYFWDILEKSNLFLEGVIESAGEKHESRLVTLLFKSPVSDGGVWNSFVNLAEKYGAVPKTAMPETASSENTGMMIKLLKRKLREQGLELRDMIAKGKKTDAVRKRKVEMLGVVYKMLAINLGEPPTEFEWRFKDKNGKISDLKKYTPQSFLKEVTSVNFDDYVMLMDDPTRPYYKLYEIEKDRNVMEGRNWKYINLPANEFKDFARNSIKANEAMYFSCDVGKQLNSKEGLLSLDNYNYGEVLGVKFGMDKKQRVMSRESGSSHGMALVAVDEDKNGKITKWLLENSWGKGSGHNGYLTMTDRWFDEFMFRVVILKKFISPKVLEILKQKPTMLPPWDPMFMEDK